MTWVWSKSWLWHQHITSLLFLYWLGSITPAAVSGNETVPTSPLSLSLSSHPPPRKITRPHAREWRNFELIIWHQATQAYDFQQHKYLGSSGNLDLWSFVTIFQNVDNINGDLAKNISENSVSLAYMTRDKFCGLFKPSRRPPSFSSK